MKHLTIYTDGSFLRGWIGYAAVCLFEGRRVELTGRETRSEQATVGRSELFAIRMALSRVVPRKRPEWSVAIYSDNQSVVQALNGRQNPRDLREELPAMQELMAEFAACVVSWRRGETCEEQRRAHYLANKARWGRVPPRMPQQRVA